MTALTFLILTLVFLQVFLAFANVNLSSTLSTNDNHAWLSPSGEFAFGFRQLSGTSHFTVAIWYDKIPDKSIVWNAKANDNTVEAPTGSQVQLTSEGLILISPEKVTIWMAQPGVVVSFGAMLDTGNFVLANKESTFVWESFKNPTDTLLPNQSLEVDGKLTSRFTETNYTRGRFQLYFHDGSVFLCSLGWPSQYRYDPYYAFDVSGSTSKLVFNNSGDIYIERTDGTRVQPHGAKWDNVTLDPEVYYYRATLDFHGVFTQYSHPRGSTSQPGWEIVRYVPNNICAAINKTLGSGPCWYNSYCSMKSDRPTCECPYGYSLIDPSNEFGGCQPNFTLGCGADIEGLQERPEEVYELHESSERDFYFAEYDIIQPYSINECKQSCLQDCMCAAASFSNNGCYKKRLPLINGRLATIPYLFFTKTRVHPLTSANKGLPTLPDSRKEDQAKPILLGTLIGSLVINSILLVVIVLVILLKPKRTVQVASLLETKLHLFTYEVLKNATQDFSEELGRGSFGIVYKGTLDSVLSHNVVAVKRLDRLGPEGEKEFKTELAAIGKTYHKNLVQLIGFCDEGIHRLLVYEFMNNGTLADILFGQPKPIWNLRVGFALGIARGLVYLHEECDTPIIHCDIKPQNILIDHHFTAKISDFGLAKLLLSHQSRTSTMIRGTKGYVAPEWFKNVPVTVKVDVYSFGVMLLEIICCRRNVLLKESGEEEKAILTDWAYDCYMERRIDALLDDDDKGAMDDCDKLQRWIKIAIWCIQENHEIRPTMGMVMQMLEGSVEVPNPPSPYSFS